MQPQKDSEASTSLSNSQMQLEISMGCHHPPSGTSGHQEGHPKGRDMRKQVQTGEGAESRTDSVLASEFRSPTSL